MFTTFIVQPIFNLLVLIYNILPGHNFGLAVIIFTIIVRLLMWPLVKKQLHQAKVMRQLQPELKRIKLAAKGNRQKESAMMMELYKERGINPFGSIGVLILQIPILIGLYSGLTRLIHDPHQLVTFSYPWIQHLHWMEALAKDIHKFDGTLFGIVDLTRPAIGPMGAYWPALVIVLASALAQYFQSKQLLPGTKESKSLRQIMRSAGQGKPADQSEVSAAVGRSTVYLIPAMIVLFTINLASALSLYWLVSGLVAFVQQSIVLRDDTTEMEDMADTKVKKDVAAIPEAEIVTADSKDTKKEKTKSSNKTKKRRKR